MGSSRVGRNKRALTGAKGGGRTASGGEPRFAEGLLEALRAPARDEGDEIAQSLTHSFHSYPARMHPATARTILAGLEPRSLLDPFCGSGTTLVEAVFARAESVGIDANPLAVRLAATKTWIPGRPLIKELSVTGRQIADACIEDVRAARRAKGARAEDKAKRPKARRGLRGQFPPHVLAELENLARQIREQASAECAPHLEMVLSSVLYKVSLRRSDTDATIVQRQIPRAAASRHFRERVVAYADSLRALDRAGGPAPTISLGDARSFEAPKGGVDLVLSSPPYPGTYDYVDHHQLRMDFLGLDSTGFGKSELGARRHFRGPKPSVDRNLERWRGDMREILTRLRSAIRSDGFVCLLVGDSLAGNRAIRANDEIPPLAEAAGLRSIAWAWQIRPALGGREKTAFAESPKREHLVLYGRA